jgi:hypothetical protein
MVLATDPDAGRGSMSGRRHPDMEDPASRARRILADAGRLLGRAGPAHTDGSDHGGSGTRTSPGRGGRSNLRVAGRRDGRQRSSDGGDPGPLARPAPPEIRSSAGVRYWSTGRRCLSTRTCRRVWRAGTWGARPDHGDRADHAPGRATARHLGWSERERGIRHVSGAGCRSAGHPDGRRSGGPRGWSP